MPTFKTVNTGYITTGYDRDKWQNPPLVREDASCRHSRESKVGLRPQMRFDPRNEWPTSRRPEYYSNFGARGLRSLGQSKLYSVRSQRREAVKVGHEARGTRNQESLCKQGPEAWRRDEMIGGKPPVVRQLTLPLVSG